MSRAIKRHRSTLSILAFSGAALTTAFLALDAQAGNPKSTVETLSNESRGSALEYWTPERLASARPMPLPRISAQDATGANYIEEQAFGEPVSGEGRAPARPLGTDLSRRLLSPEQIRAIQSNPAWTDEGDELVGNNVGTLGAHFSSTRVFPDAATTTYPYLTVGKLFFTVPGEGNFICSGSVLRPRVVLTAGHCVHSGDNSPGFHTNFLFVPAFRNGVAPAGSWDWNFVVAPTAWTQGGGNFPNAQDIAMIETDDLLVNGVATKIGTITGFLGFTTLKLFPNHTTMLGYPANHDTGMRMHQVNAESFNKVNPNAVQYGSDMRGGSSGGPWVQNFGVVAAGQTGGSNTGSNRVVGVTSFGFVSTTPLAQGSSVPDSRFSTVLTTVCNHRAGNC